MAIFLIVFLLLSAVAFAVLMNLRKADPFEQGKAAFLAQDYVNSIELMQKVLADEPFHPQAHYYLAEAYRRLNLFPEALKHLKEVKNIGIYDSLVKKSEVYHRLADYQQMLSLYNDALKTNLEILEDNPQDEKAVHRLLLMALGERRFDIANIYAQTILGFENQSQEMLKAVAVTFYYNHKADVSFQIIEKLLQESPHDTDLQLTYIAMCRDTHYPQAMEKILTLLKHIEDNNEKRKLIHFFIHMAVRQEKFNDAVSFLEQRVANPDYPDNLREDMYFFYVLLLIKISNFHKAEKALEDMEQYSGIIADRVRSLMPFVKAKSLTVIVHDDTAKYASVATSYVSSQKETKDEENFSVEKFEPIYEENIEDLFPPDFLYQISRYTANFHLNFDQFFSVSAQGSASMRKMTPAESKDKNKAALLGRYASLNSDALFRFARLAVIELGFKNNGKEFTAPDKDGVDIFTQKQFDKSNTPYLISFRRFAANAKISDIYLNSYIRRVKETKAEKAVFISNATFTEAAQSKLKQMQSIEVASTAKLLELLQTALQDN